MRVDVDFNERDRRGHVVARVSAALASQLTVGQRVSLYDPPEKLWADAVVTRINQNNHIAAFDVDWHSFEDAAVVQRTSARPRTLVTMQVTRTIKLFGGAVPPSALAWKLEQHGVEVQPWEPPIEDRGIGTDIVIGIVVGGGIEAIKAAVADFRKTFPRAHVEIEGEEEDQGDEGQEEDNDAEPPGPQS